MSEVVKVVGPSSDVPHCVHVQLTTECNMACKGCFYKGTKTAQWPDKKIEKLILEAQELGVKWLAFGGGEPTLHPCITGLLAMAHTAGLRTAVTTNGKQLTYMPADVIHISHDKMHCPRGMSLKKRDAVVRQAIRYFRYTAPKAVIGLNTLVTDFCWIPIDTLRLVDVVTLLLPKPNPKETVWWGDEMDGVLDTVKRYGLKLKLATDGCLFHLIKLNTLNGCALGSLCSQGRLSMALDARGRASACSNIKTTYPAKGIKDGWEKVRRKSDVDPVGCIMPRTTGQ